MIPEDLLAQGLKAEFSKETEISTIERGGVTFTVSDYTNKFGRHHDEYTGDILTSGQEIVTLINGSKISRVYGGGVRKVEELEELGCNKSMIMEFLASIITENFNSIRLYKNFQRIIDDFEYTYTVNDRNSTIPITNATEEIFYKGVLVFRHDFVINPIES